MKIQNNKIKIATILASLIIGLTLVSPTIILPNVNAASLSQHIEYLSPTLSPSENQAVINTALAIPELQNWSHNWQYVHTAFLGNNKAGTPDFKWQYAIVDLKAPSNSAPVRCDQDWLAWVEIDMTTMKVVRATYPTLNSYACHYATGTGVGTNHTWTVAEENDVNSGTHHYYGNYAEIALPQFNTSVYTDLHGAFVEEFVNAIFPHSTGCSPTNGCLEQAGWILTSVNSSCVGCHLYANTDDIIYVDQAVHGTYDDYNTGLEWINGSTSTLYGEIDCAYTSPDYGIVINNGTNSFTETTTIPCTSTQKNDVTNNSVFFENAANETSSTWSGDITGTVSTTNALEYKDSTQHSALVAWSASNNVDISCYGKVSASQVITGTLASGTTATWSSLNKQPASMSNCK
jgi:hypothetical protein